MALTKQQENDLFVFGEAYTEVSKDGTQRRIDPTKVKIILNKKGKIIRYEWK